MTTCSGATDDDHSCSTHGRWTDRLEHFRSVLSRMVGFTRESREIERDGERSWPWIDGEAPLSSSQRGALSGALRLRVTGVFDGLRSAQASDGTAGCIAY